jgi:cystathionine gamma-synthase
VISAEPELHERVRFVQKSVGAVPGPFDCFLVHRGIRTLALRVARHTDNGRAVSEWLRGTPSVEEVTWPGFGGMIAFRHPDAVELVGRTELFALAESLGGVESLIEHPGAMTHASTAGSQLEVPEDLVRLSVGIEHPGDLLADLRQALTT